jgi:hypothetical protein
MPCHRQWWSEAFHEDNALNGSLHMRDLKERSASRSVSVALVAAAMFEERMLKESSGIEIKRKSDRWR